MPCTTIEPCLSAPKTKSLSAKSQNVETPRARFPRLAHCWQSLWQWLARPADRADLHSQRSFMQETLGRSPDAFTSDLDLETLMHYYSDHR